MENTMSIEEKLDIFLEKVDECDTFLDAVTDGEWEFILKDSYLKMVYNNHQSLSVKDRAIADNEYSQIVVKCREDGYITYHAVHQERYTRTVKGGSFKGYQKTKEKEEWDERLIKAQTYLVSIGSIFAIIFGSLETHDRLTKSDQSSEATLNLILLNQSEIQETLSNLYLLEIEEKEVNRKSPASSKALSTENDTTDSDTVK